MRNIGYLNRSKSYWAIELLKIWRKGHPEAAYSLFFSLRCHGCSLQILVTPFKQWFTWLHTCIFFVWFYFPFKHSSSINIDYLFIFWIYFWPPPSSLSFPHSSHFENDMMRTPIIGMFHNSRPGHGGGRRLRGMEVGWWRDSRWIIGGEGGGFTHTNNNKNNNRYPNRC